MNYLDVTFFSILLFGFILGIKHALEPDHVIAVSTIVSESKRFWRSSLAGIYWGIGHTVTLFIIGTMVIIMKGEIPEIWAMSLEFLVGIMLVLLGVYSFRILRGKNKKVQTHVFPFKKHHYALKTMVIGFIHGLAGSAAMVILTMTTVQSVGEGVAYIVVFGLGTITGMALCTMVIGLPFILSNKNMDFNNFLRKFMGFGSVCYGLYYMYHLGIKEGLFHLWTQI